ncbi:unnamed protein product [Linum trigynum]|uniref:Uncharacterized protein n=1 Tax=Linum trigynum TaxID=586398 RepID=A0AAV2EK16_9ROSI
MKCVDIAASHPPPPIIKISPGPAYNGVPCHFRRRIPDQSPVPRGGGGYRVCSDICYRSNLLRDEELTTKIGDGFTKGTNVQRVSCMELREESKVTMDEARGEMEEKKEGAFFFYFFGEKGRNFEVVEWNGLWVFGV